jgi:hypothetical protein
MNALTKLASCTIPFYSFSIGLAIFTFRLHVKQTLNLKLSLIKFTRFYSSCQLSLKQSI